MYTHTFCCCCLLCNYCNGHGQLKKFLSSQLFSKTGSGLDQKYADIPGLSNICFQHITAKYNVHPYLLLLLFTMLGYGHGQLNKFLSSQLFSKTGSGLDQKYADIPGLSSVCFEHITAKFQIYCALKMLPCLSGNFAVININIWIWGPGARRIVERGVQEVLARYYDATKGQRCCCCLPCNHCSNWTWVC